MTTAKQTGEINYPVSFRLPLSQVKEMDAALAKEPLKRRADLLAVIWEAAWKEYKAAGSLSAFLEGRRSRRYSKRLSEELQDQLYAALEMIIDGAPSAVVEDAARYLTAKAGKYGDSKR